MTPETSGFVPVRDRIANHLREAIASGELKPGDALPSLSVISAEWEVAKATAEGALALLRDEGLVVPGGRGKPATVQAPKKRHNIYLSDGWTQQQKDLVLRPEAERRETGAIELTAGISIDDTDSSSIYTETPADAEQAEILGVEPGTPLVQRVYEMVHKSTGLRCSWSVSYIPRALIEGNPALLDQNNEPWPGGHQHQLYTVGIELARFTRTVFSAQPTPSERAAWGMNPGTPMLHVLSRSIDTQDRVVEYSEARYPADTTEITVTEELRPWTSEQLNAAGDA
ncbi:GntR family transcriptional regulator [Saccharopolyspora sp. TS4A08]|uniref:GntR family transcriptional regulator n=1 Tax=Saccharopolyspora ipomoeae TaxID=3042027 RepID=A0ABT6PT03_9PSEU|nr:GntR family transcriptional regulator [Saccharopolyspora sp. TS4A08]MDI2031108.1 GntR family transcriptional regulator [Saccharopolyspora sp. TS4A08]